VLALWAQRRALGAYFSLDDLVIFEEHLGLRPLVLGPWRLLSRGLWFGAGVPVFGANPIPWHLASALLHALCVVLLFSFARRRGAGIAAATLAAGAFGVTRLHATAIASAACVGEPMALALVLAACLIEGGGRARALARAALFALAMLAKESVVLLPALLLLPGPGAPPLPERARRAAPVLAATVLVALVLAATGAGGTHLGGEAYARALGPNVGLNLLTYTSWALDLTTPLPGAPGATLAWPLALAMLAVLAGLAALAWRATTLPALGAAWWLAALLPVLPLLHHSYLYYLYVPLAGLALAAGGSLEWALARRAPAGAFAVALALIAMLAWRSDALLAEREREVMPGTGIPLDPELRKSENARAAVRAVGETLRGGRGRVAFLLPASVQRARSAITGQIVDVPAGARGYSMLEGALDEGRALRAVLPGVDSVAFLAGWQPGYGEFELFAQSPDGNVFSLGRGADGFARAGAGLLESGQPARAIELLVPALAESPGSAALREQLQLARAAAAQDSASAPR
jgi:hypothetical protein